MPCDPYLPRQKQPHNWNSQILLFCIYCTTIWLQGQLKIIYSWVRPLRSMLRMQMLNVFFCRFIDNVGQVNTHTTAGMFDFWLLLFGLYIFVHFSTCLHVNCIYWCIVFFVSYLFANIVIMHSADGRIISSVDCFSGLFFFIALQHVLSFTAL